MDGGGLVSAAAEICADLPKLGVSVREITLIPWARNSHQRSTTVPPMKTTYFSHHFRRGASGTIVPCFAKASLWAAAIAAGDTLVKSIIAG